MFSRSKCLQRTTGGRSCGATSAATINCTVSSPVYLNGIIHGQKCRPSHRIHHGGSSKHWKPKNEHIAAISLLTWQMLETTTGDDGKLLGMSKVHALSTMGQQSYVQLAEQDRAQLYRCRRRSRIGFCCRRGLRSFYLRRPNTVTQHHQDGEVK